MADTQKKILLFDDDYESMVAVKQYLERALGLQVELTAERAVPERLVQERFDLICVDLMIHPTSLNAADEEVENVHFEGVNWRKTGLEFLHRLRQGEFSQAGAPGTSPDVPVLVLSAVANYSIGAELGQAMRIEGYLEKPFALEEITEQIRRLLPE
jgi:CheY-like chemotaxis protein